MIVKPKKDDRVRLFEDLKPSEVFYKDDAYWMKMDLMLESVFNAVRLFDGMQRYFKDGTVVRVINGSFVEE